MAAARKKETKTENPDATRPERAMFTIEDLEQVKVLADPLRLKILEQLCEGELTTKQIAEKIGEKPTKLYHHVDSLERVGLIRLARTRQNRGTLEKYYVAIARAFQAGADVFSGADEGGDEKREVLEQVVGTMLDRTTRELRALASRRGSLEELQKEGLLSFLEVQASAEEMAQIEARLKSLVEDLTQHCSPAEKPENARSYRLTLAFYPIDLERDGEQ